MCSMSGSLHAASRLSYGLESSSTFSASVRAQMCLRHRGAQRDCTAHNKVRLGRLGGAPSPHVAGSLCCPEPSKDAPPLTVCPRPSGNGVRTPKRNLCSAFIRVKTKRANPCGLCGLPKWSRSGSNRRPLACHASPACRSTTNAFSTGGYAVLESCDLLQRLKGRSASLPRELGLADDIHLEKLKLLRSGSAQRAGPLNHGRTCAYMLRPSRPRPTTRFV